MTARRLDDSIAARLGIAARKDASPLKRKRSRALDYLVYVAVRLIVAAGQAMSIERSYALADGLARLLHRLDRRHRAVGIENLRQAFGDELDDGERERLVREVYRHFCRMLVEMLHIPRKLHATNWRDRVELVGHEKAVDRLIRGGPVILLSGHFGNWEMAGYLFGVFGFTPHAVARDLDNPYLDRFLRQFRERTGQRTIPKNGGYERIVEVLGGGGVVSFLADQDAGQRGLYVDFFGRPASTHKAIALLAIEHNAPVVVGYARRIGPGFRYEVGCEEVVDPAELSGTADDVRLLTQRYTAALERVIRRAPEQYLWLHRRWKHQPESGAARRARKRGPSRAA